MRFSRKWTLLSKQPPAIVLEIMSELTLRNEPAKYTFDDHGCSVTTFSSFFRVLVAQGHVPHMLYARAGKAIVGWAAMFVIPKKTSLAVFDDIKFMFYVHPDYRRQGIAKQLAKIVKRLTNQPITIGEGNEASHHFRRWLDTLNAVQETS